MKVLCLVRDASILIDCGEGFQRVKWLAMVATQRYDDLLAATDGGFTGGVSKKHVPVGLQDEGGRRIPPTKTVNRLPAALAAHDSQPISAHAEPRVRVLLLEDLPAGAKNGTSQFLTAIAAVPEMCLVVGSGLVSCVPKLHSTFTVYCRDNFSIPIRNGGEDLSVQFTSDAGVALRADVDDHRDGSYSVTYALPRRGAYTVDITIDGDHVIGSPFECVATETELPASLKWLRPSFCNGSVPDPAALDTNRLRALALSATDALLLGEQLNTAWALHLPNLKYTRLALKGHFPPPAAQAPEPRVDAALALVGGRVFLHGGVLLAAAPPAHGFELLDASGAPLAGDGAGGEPDAQVDGALWLLDVEARTWLSPETAGARPPPLCCHAACAHASHLFVHGGRAGRSPASRASAELYVLATGPLLWERLPAVAAPGHSVPAARWGHSLTSAGSRLFLFGGQTQAGELLAGPHVFDVGARDWSSPGLTGLPPRARHSHSATVWGRWLVLGCGLGQPEGAGPGAATEVLAEVSLVELGSVLSRLKRTAAAAAAATGAGAGTASSAHAAAAGAAAGAGGGGEVERLHCSSHASSVGRWGHSLLASRQLLLLGGHGAAEPSALPLLLVPAGHMLLQTEATDVLVPQPAARLPGNYSVECWVCAALIEPMSILCKTSSLGPRSLWSHQLRLDADGRVEHALCLGRGQEWLVCRSAARLHPNHWYYLAGTLTVGETDSELLHLRIYVNGVKEDEEVSDKAGLHQPDTLDRFCIGGESGGGFGPFCGVIADVSVWQYALMPESVANTWLNRLQPDTHDAHLVGHWKLNEGHLPAATVASGTITSHAPPPLWDQTQTNAQHVLDYSIYSNQGVVRGRPRCSATTVPLYFDAKQSKASA